MGVSVYVMRHGRAEAGGNKPDDERRLSADGSHGMALAAQGLKRLHVHLDCILSSPLVRAWQTAEAIQQVVAPDILVRESASLGPETHPQAVLHTLLQLDAACRNILVVGHLPGIAALLRMLVLGQEGGGFCFEPATIARVEFGQTVRAATGQLRWMLPAQHLEMLGAHLP